VGSSRDVVASLGFRFIFIFGAGHDEQELCAIPSAHYERKTRAVYASLR